MSKYRNNRRKRKSGFDVLDAELVPLTNVLIRSLIMGGMRAADLRTMKREGLMYCPARNSFMTPWQLVE